MGKAVLEDNTSGAIVGRNLYGRAIDEILLRTDPTVNSGQPFYSQQDHEGSVTHLTSATGTIIEKYKYDAFGAPTFYNGSGTQISATAYANRFLFTGREYAATFSFYEYRARAYHPTLGRFMSEDPKGFDAGDYNLYRYCHNDPLDMTDPMGLEELPGIKPPPPRVPPPPPSQPSQPVPQQSVTKAQTQGQGNVPARVTLAKDEKAVKKDSPSIYRYQLVNSRSDPVTGSDISAKEHVISKHSDGNVQIINKDSERAGLEGYKRVSSKGIYTDVVGPLAQPSRSAKGYTDQTYSFTVRMYGNFYDLSTIMRHQTVIVNGDVTNTVTIVRP